MIWPKSSCAATGLLG